MRACLATQTVFQLRRTHRPARRLARQTTSRRKFFRRTVMAKRWIGGLWELSCTSAWWVTRPSTPKTRSQHAKRCGSQLGAYVCVDVCAIARAKWVFGCVSDSGLSIKHGGSTLQLHSCSVPEGGRGSIDTQGSDSELIKYKCGPNASQAFNKLMPSDRELEDYFVAATTSADAIE